MDDVKTNASDLSKQSSTKKSRTCKIHLLNGQQFLCEVSKQANGNAILKQIYELLNIVEYDYFGLYFNDLSQEKYWLEPNKSIKKQVKNGPWTFHFAVKFYPSDPNQLHEDITRYYMVLQLRDDIVEGRLPCSFVTHALLGSYVVQSELGDFDNNEMKGNYVEDFDFAPNQTAELENKVMALHQTHRGQTPAEAELNFLEKAKKLPLYGVDLHESQDSDGVKLLVGISWNGVLIYRDETLINRFAWPRVVKLSYIRSKFYVTLRPLDGESQLNMVGFKMPNHRAAKRLWKSGVEHHAFFRLDRSDRIHRKKLIRVGSKFRYSGRTQMETRKAVGEIEQRPAPTIVRTHSKRLRSEGSIKYPAKSSLKSVSEEEIEEPPPLPDKEHKHPIEEIITTTTVEETLQTSLTAPVKPPRRSMKIVTPPPASPQQNNAETLEHKTSFDIMTDHQRTIHKMKANENELNNVEFLASSTRHGHSMDSLDEIDSRLPATPRKPEIQIKNKFDEMEESSESEMTTQNQSFTVLTYISDERSQSDKSEEGEIHKIESSSSSSSNRSSISVEAGEVVANGYQEEDEEQRIGVIRTVETRTIRIEDAVIPHNENEIHEVSLWPEVQEKRMSTSSLSSESSNHSLNHSPVLYNKPPTVLTEAVVVECCAEIPPEGTTQPPVVQTETKTITYEADKPTPDSPSDDMQLFSSQIISSETEHTITTTEITKVGHGDVVSKTMVERQVISTGDQAIDTHQVVVDMIRDANLTEPSENITKVVVQEERPIIES